jgi:hypothetical protein
LDFDPIGRSAAYTGASAQSQTKVRSANTHAISIALIDITANPPITTLHEQPAAFTSA